MKNDLISRSAAKDEILSLAVIINKPHLLSKEDTLHVLDTLPAVDAEEVFESLPYVKEALEMAKQRLAPVVRCKDCKCGKHPDSTRLVGKYVKCALYDPMPLMRSDDFCSYGEQRADADSDLSEIKALADPPNDPDLEHMTRFAMQQALQRK